MHDLKLNCYWLTWTIFYFLDGFHCDFGNFPLDTFPAVWFNNRKPMKKCNDEGVENGKTKTEWEDTTWTI